MKRYQNIRLGLGISMASLSAIGSIYTNDMDYVLGDVKQAFIQDKISTEAQCDNLLIGFQKMGVNGIRVPIFAEGLDPNKPMFDYFFQQALDQGFLIFANPAQSSGGHRIANGILNGTTTSVYDDPVATQTLINRIQDFAAEYPCKWINAFNEDGQAGAAWSADQMNTIYSTLHTNLNGAEQIGPGVWGIPASIQVLNNTDLSDYITVATTHNLGFHHSRWAEFIAVADAADLPVWDSEVNHYDKFGTGTRLEAALANEVDGLVLYNSWTGISLSNGSVNSGNQAQMALYLKSTPGLVASWTMDEGAGTAVADVSGSHFDGTEINAVWVGGMNGHALSFNGSSSRVKIPATVFGTIDDELTIALWVYGGTTQPRQDSVFFAVDSSGTRLVNIHLPWSDSKVYWDAGNSTGYDRISKTATADQVKGQWNHWVFTKNAATGVMNIYVNGELFQTGSGKTRSISGITQAVIGGQVAALGYDGTLDEVQLYNFALTGPEVAALYQSSVNPYTLWAGTAFHGAPGGTDQSGTGNPDGDRFNNKQEWALVTDPLMADEPRLESGVSNANFTAMYYRRDPAETGVDVYASWSTSLTNEVWRLNGDGMTESSNGWSNAVETVSVMLPLEHTNGFIRIQAEEQ
ncbi:LamG domain-containing protein [Pontiellaceae bacterium B12227]|nr:LamG domain-containing protein [Pontiellaceae bacterium B12227]